jgi:hypothetical protein
MVQQKLPTFEDISITLHHGSYDKKTKRLLLSKVNIKRNEVLENHDCTFDAKGLKDSSVLKVYKVTRKVLGHVVGEHVKEL